MTEARNQAQESVQTDAEALAQAIRSVSSIVVLTGAGISTESGIPDFRSPGGVWSRYRPVMFQEFLASEEARQRYWAYKKETFPSIAQAEPNAGHLALAELERLGRLQALLTQNIDGLHQDAGNSAEKVIELHGTERWVTCLDCDARLPRAEIQERLEAGETVPLCESCGGRLKPATISFGQMLPEEVLRRAVEESENCEAFLVVGSSLQVHPAAGLPHAAKMSGAWLGILNRDHTPLDGVADWRSGFSAGQVLEAMIKEIQR